MSHVHKPLTGPKLLTQIPQNEYGRSSIEVHEPSFLEFPSLAAPTSHGPCPEDDGCWLKNMHWNVVENLPELGSLKN
jgi:hypothetical protein